LEAEVVRLRSEVEQLRQGLMHAITEIESRSRSNIVPLRQAMARFGERPSIFDPDR
jgi:MerR family transcriptional regulator/heat shock protein HspR